MICAENNSIDAGQNVCLLQIDERSKFQTQKGPVIGEFQGREPSGVIFGALNEGSSRETHGRGARGLGFDRRRGS